MPEVSQHDGRGIVAPPPDRQRMTESDKCFELERLEESRKRFASLALWAGSLSLLLLVVPNPIARYAGVAAMVLALHALARILLQPACHAGTRRALLGLAMGLVATLVSGRS